MLTARASGDPVPGYAGNTYVLDVISAGVRVFMYDKGYLHAKNQLRNVLEFSGSSQFELDPRSEGQEQGWFRALPAPR